MLNSGEKRLTIGERSGRKRKAEINRSRTGLQGVAHHTIRRGRASRLHQGGTASRPLTPKFLVCCDLHWGCLVHDDHWWFDYRQVSVDKLDTSHSASAIVQYNPRRGRNVCMVTPYRNHRRQRYLYRLHIRPDLPDRRRQDQT